MKKTIQSLQGTKFDVPPIWLMRQAGRYLPEYLKVRGQYDDFMQFCFDPDAVKKVTLQPIERFDFDAAIIFSDILVIPHVLGQTVKFEKNHGPILDDIEWLYLFEKAHQLDLVKVMAPIVHAIQSTRKALSDEKALFGFAGSPWTIATYMISRGKTQNFEHIKPFIENNADVFEQLIDVLTHKVIEWLQLQVNAGCDVVQIFDSWAGMVPNDQQEKILFKPLEKIVNALQQSHSHAPIVYFGKGIAHCYPLLSERVRNIVFGLDQFADIGWINTHLDAEIPVQGNLDPMRLRGGDFEAQIHQIKDVFRERPYVFNLGHGILPDTPIEHVEKMIHLVRSSQ